MTQPTYLVHPEQLQDAEQRVLWQEIADVAKVLVVARVAVPGVPLATWLARQPAAGGTG